MDHSTDWAAERFVKKQLRDPRNRACAKGFAISAVLSYLYFVTNNLDNHDNISFLEQGYGAGASSGRWFLQILGRKMTSWGMAYNIPVFNVTVGLVFLLLAAVLAVRILRIQDTRLCFGLGAITASFPVIASTMFYAYAVQFYCFSILLGTVGVRLAQERRWYRFLAPGFFALSLGIYQAYFPYIGALLVLDLIRETLDEQNDWKAVVKDSFLYLLLLLLGYFLYMGLSKFFLLVFHTTLNTYMGISDMGKLTVQELLFKVTLAYKNYGRLFTDGYLGISVTKVLRLAFAANFFFVLLSVILDWRNRPLLKNLELCVLLLLLPLAANAVIIMAPVGELHMLMLYGLVSLFYLPLLMAQNLKQSVTFRKAAVLFVCLITIGSSLSYAYQSNGNYRSLYYTNKKMENYYAMLLAQARSVEGYQEDMEIVFTDQHMEDSSLHDSLDQSFFRYGVVNPDLHIAVEAYSRPAFISHYFGIETRNASAQELSEYAPILDEMATYPNSGSIRIIDDKVFVKCG